MGRETNIDSILVLEAKIREHEIAVIGLKRARNSLLNISKLPPEPPGKIFHCNVAPKDDFGGLDEGSHNFLLVCHHWFEVASRTPELWGSWGNSLKGWARWCRCSRTAPLDLALIDLGDNNNNIDFDGFDGYGDEPHQDYSEDPVLCDALRDRAAQDTIRRVHLVAPRHHLQLIIDLLTANRGEPQPNSVKSIILQNGSPDPVNISTFFAHYRFPKLRRLELNYCSTSSWDHLSSRTSVLTTLELDFSDPSPTPTTSQLLSILASNPALRKVGLTDCAVPDDGGGESSIRVQLYHLKELRLDGDSPRVIRLLDKLEHPRNLDSLSLILRGSDVTDVSQSIGPYLRDHLQRRDRPQNGLRLRISSREFSRHYIELHAGDAGGINFSGPEWEWRNTFVKVSVVLKSAPPEGVLEKTALDFIACAPLEGVVCFRTRDSHRPGGHTCTISKPEGAVIS